MQKRLLGAFIGAVILTGLVAWGCRSIWMAPGGFDWFLIAATPIGLVIFVVAVAIVGATLGAGVVDRVFSRGAE